MKIKTKLVGDSAKLPVKAHNSDAGFDMYATSIKREFTLSGDPVYVEYDTGVVMDIPKGYAGFLFPRSSITKKQMILKNSVGIIDSGYQDTIRFRFWYFDNYKKLYDVGERIGQIVILKLPEIELELTTEDLDETERGLGGFGHTGNK